MRIKNGIISRGTLDIERSARVLQKWMKERYDCGSPSQNPLLISTTAGPDAAYGEGYGIGVVVLLANPSLAFIEHGYAKPVSLHPRVVSFQGTPSDNGSL